MSQSLQLQAPVMLASVAWCHKSGECSKPKHVADHLDKNMYRCVLRKYVELLSSFFLSDPNFTYRPINNYISPSSVGPPGEKKEVPQIGIRQNQKPEIYVQFWPGNHLSNWEGNWRATLLWSFAKQIVRERESGWNLLRSQWRGLAREVLNFAYFTIE